MEALRAGLGAFIGLWLTGYFFMSPGVDLENGLYLVAPLGATAVLLFAVPNSPLAQPWSAVIGNTVAALVGVAVSMFIHEPALRIAVAVALAIIVTFMLRAVHPPAGAVAMTAAMSPEAVEHLGFWFALAPIAHRVGFGAVDQTHQKHFAAFGNHFNIQRADFFVGHQQAFYPGGDPAVAASGGKGDWVTNADLVLYVFDALNPLHQLRCGVDHILARRLAGQQ